MDRGELVSDDVMIGIIRERLDRADAVSGFVLDGFPRTVAQAAVLDAMMVGRAPLLVVDIAVPEAELMRRLGRRLICGDCGANGAAADMACGRCNGPLVQRADDNDDVVRERLKVYHRQSAPLVEYYRARPTFRSIDGEQTVDRVFDALVAAVEGSVESAGVGR
jgi:adenylate kinase